MTTIKELESLTYTEYINLNNSYKIAQNWVEIIKDLPPKRQEKIKEQQKIEDKSIEITPVVEDIYPESEPSPRENTLKSNKNKKKNKNKNKNK